MSEVHEEQQDLVIAPATTSIEQLIDNIHCLIDGLHEDLSAGAEEASLRDNLVATIMADPHSQKEVLAVTIATLAVELAKLREQMAPSYTW